MHTEYDYVNTTGSCLDDSQGPAVASLYENDVAHRAYVLDSTIAWYQDGRFMRSFHFGNISESIKLWDGHVVFTRFREAPDSSHIVALCVFYTDMLYIFYQNGENFTISLPFEVERVCPIYIGILVQRRICTNIANRRMLPERLPTIFSLVNPRSEFKMLGLSKLSDSDQVQRQMIRPLDISPLIPGEKAFRIDSVTTDHISPFTDPSCVLVGTAVSSRDPSIQYITCRITNVQKFVVYKCFVTFEPCEVDAGHFNSQTPNLNWSHSISSDHITAKQVSKSAHRRSSIINRRRSGIGSTIKTNRRSSMLGRISFNDSPGLGSVVDEFYEQKQMRAEVILQLCWKDWRQAEARKQYNGQNTDVCITQSSDGNDVVCILQKDPPQVIGLRASDFSEVFVYPARSIAAMPVTRHNLDDLVIITPTGSVSIICGEGEPIAYNTPHTGAISCIYYSEGTVAMVQTRSGEIELSISIHTSHILRCLISALSFVLSTPTYQSVKRCIFQSICDVENSKQELDCITSLILGIQDSCLVSSPLSFEITNELQSRAPAVLFVLHLVYEEALLGAYESYERLVILQKLISQFALQNNLHKQYQYYMQEGFPCNESLELQKPELVHIQKRVIIPSFSRWIQSTFGNQQNAHPAKPFPMPELATIIFDIKDSSAVYFQKDDFKRLRIVTNIVWQIFCKDDRSAILGCVAEYTCVSHLLRQFNTGTRWLLRNIITQCRNCCSQHWPNKTLEFLGRRDLLANINCDFSISHEPYLKRQSDIIDYNRERQGSAHTDNQGIATICDQTIELAETLDVDGCKIDRIASTHPISLIAFNRDLRVEEVQNLLQSSKPVGLNTVLAGTGSSEDIENMKTSCLNDLVHRTLALPTGRALFTYSTHNLNTQDALYIPSIDVSARFPGHKLPSKWVQGNDNIDWPLFHNGVAAALSLNREQAKAAHSSWILLNWPSELSTASSAGGGGEEESQRKYNEMLDSHAGFLLGMGLIIDSDHPPSTTEMRTQLAIDHQSLKRNGPLCNMPPWQSFKYLSARHDLVTIALLLGCACACKGTKDSSVSRLLELHIPSLLPSGSSELMLLSYGTQATAILGLGILYLGTQNRRIVEIALRELSRSLSSVPGSINNNLNDPDCLTNSSEECYSLAAGLSIGLLMLGHGESTKTLSDLNILDTLTQLLSTSHSNDSWGQQSSASKPRSSTLPVWPNSNTDIPSTARTNDSPQMPALSSTASEVGSVAAIGLTFIGTNYKPAAQRLALPPSYRLVCSVDNFTLLWRTLMRCLIMIDDIEPTVDWIESNIPSHMKQLQPTIPAHQRKRIYILAGSCFALALAYSGTEDQRAYSVLLKYFDELALLISSQQSGYESKLTFAAVQTCLNVVCVSVSLVMAGSGDISILKRLRNLHGISHSRTYGSHMAVHMAIGLLFVGNGARLTVSRSKESIALLLIAFFPLFPKTQTDNHSHVQAWRHLWALCIKPRCLSVRDIDTGEICHDISVSLTQNGVTVTRGSSSLLLLNDLKDVESISIRSPGYFSLDLDLSCSKVKNALLRKHSIYIQPFRQGCYEQISNDSNLCGIFRASSTTLGANQIPYQWVDAVLESVNEFYKALEQSALSDSALTPIQRVPPKKIFDILQSIRQMRIHVFLTRASGTEKGMCLSIKHAATFVLEEETNGDPYWTERITRTWSLIWHSALDLFMLNKHLNQTLRNYLKTGCIEPSHLAPAIYLCYSVFDFPTPVDCLEITNTISSGSLTRGQIEKFIQNLFDACPSRLLTVAVDAMS